MLKKILGFFSLIVMAVFYALKIQPKKQSEEMQDNIKKSYNQLADADKYEFSKRIDSKLNG